MPEYSMYFEKFDEIIKEYEKRGGKYTKEELNYLKEAIETEEF